jgi:hypothetical protein
MEVESNSSNTFLNIFVTNKEAPLVPAVYRKPTHCGRCLH